MLISEHGTLARNLHSSGCSKTLHMTILRSWGGKKSQVLGFLQPISQLHGHKGGVIPPLSLLPC